VPSVKILLVRLRQIGDVVFTTPTLAALKAQFPSAALTYLVEPAAAAVVAGNPHLSQVRVVPKTAGASGFLADMALGRSLAREHFDLAIDFHGGPRASLLTWLSRAPVRVGYAITGRGWMYTHQVDRPRALRARHSVENQWDLLEAVGVPPADRERYATDMPVDPTAAARIIARLDTHRVDPGARLVVMHVSAGNPFRRWPLSAFAEVASGLAALDPAVHVLVTSGPSEAYAAAQVITLAQARLEVHARHQIVACGDFSLAELRALVERAALYIGGDSGPMHVASCSAVPMVSLYGPTLPARSEPWRSRRLPSVAIEVDGLPCRPCDQRVCAPGDFRCLARITPQAVLDASARLLGRNG